MLVFPIKSDRPQRHTPWVNYALIASNVVVFLLTYSLDGGSVRPSHYDYLLSPSEPRLFQFITYQFLHADIWHLLGNMLFLYVFGNPMEDRLGKIGYLGFYLSAGVLAGLGHALIEVSPVLGASGAVAGVTGAYLALFPQSNITLFYWLFLFIGTFEVSSLLLIGFQIGFNVLMQWSGSAGVAYMAHLAGYAFGFVMGMGMLWLRILPREPFDLLALIEHRRRRAQFAALTREGYRPWESSASEGLKTTDPVTGKIRKLTPAEEQQLQQVMAQRAAISQALSEHQLDLATQRYQQLLQRDATQVMNQDHQLDLANHLMAQQSYETAAQAYELFLSTYRGYPQREQIELILGLIYARYLDQAARAQELLTAALPRLRDPAQRQLAEEVLQQFKQV